MALGKKLLILSEAGDNIGYGHYTRCSAIRSYFVEQGVSVSFILHVRGSEHSQYNDVSISDWTGNIENINSDGEYSHVLIDSYLAPASIFEILNPRFEKVVALDDYHRIDKGPHLIINPNVFGNKITYQNVAVGGPDFIILRSSFRNEHRKYSFKKEIMRVLITVGGSDFRKLIPTLIDIASRILSAATIDVVAGNAGYCGELRSMYASNHNVNFHGFVSEDLMKTLMLASDVAISACGQTLHELAWLRIPAIGICIGDDQIMNMKEYVSMGFLTEELYWNDYDLKERIENMLRMMQDTAERISRSESAASILDNEGLCRIYNEIFN
jgi:UDP-2,4-diacetamido-2,4,6-trideoxy-beta-L-altropyranose hydrolase